mmetsp:Transcript_26469/g.76423  ORF Transcript_26469/g.76423 Transcript_26469/m.76423 type:complete len:215 (-) Transcript_26469:1789-2433(-)
MSMIMRSTSMKDARKFIFETASRASSGVMSGTDGGSVGPDVDALAGASSSMPSVLPAKLALFVGKPSERPGDARNVLATLYRSSVPPKLSTSNAVVRPLTKPSRSFMLPNGVVWFVWAPVGVSDSWNTAPDMAISACVDDQGASASSCTRCWPSCHHELGGRAPLGAQPSVMGARRPMPSSKRRTSFTRIVASSLAATCVRRCGTPQPLRQTRS